MSSVPGESPGGNPWRLPGWLKGWLPQALLLALFFLVPAGWPRGAGLLAFVLSVDARLVRAEGLRRAYRSPSFLLVSAGAFAIAVHEFVGSFSATTLIVVLASSCTGVGLFLSRDLWDGIARTRRALFAIWCVAVAALGSLATVVVVHHARAHPFGAPFVEGWGLFCVVALAVLAILGGLAIFPAGAPWGIALIWLFLGSWPAVLAVDPTLLAMGEAKSTGIAGACLTRHHDCHGFAQVAGLMALISPLTLAALAIAAFAVKSLLKRRPRRTVRPT
jgi:hypothetical protein